MLKNKAFMTQAFFYILLALLVFIPTILWASKLISGTTRQAENSFENLVKYTNEIARDPSYTMDSIPLYMDENTFIMFINADTKSVFILLITW